MKILELYLFPEKKAPAIQKEFLFLKKGEGILGDCHADGGEKQITLIGSRGKSWMQEQEIKGLCFHKCKENICIEGSIREWKKGMQINLGTTVIEITQDQKGCYPEDCPRNEHKENCVLYQELRFAKVIKGGELHITKNN